MSSFYGGKQGRTYHIVLRYDSINNMVEAFSQGGAYTDANYGLYVLIDTVLSTGRSNMENGLLYRRGFDYNDFGIEKPIKSPTLTDLEFLQRWSEYVQNPGAGAIYVGQIVGPEGRTPELNLEQWSDFIAQLAEDGNFGSKSNIIINQLNSGKEDDEIKAGYINIKDEHGDTIGGFLSFDIPKMVMESEVINHGAYSTAGVVETPASTSHPHWYKWDFTIPDGKHGVDLHDMKIETGEKIGENEYFHTIDNNIIEGKEYYIYSLENEQFELVDSPVLEDIDLYYEKIVSEDEYFTYSIQDYLTRGLDDYTAAYSITLHLGRWPYRVIDDIIFVNDVRFLVNWEDLRYVEIGELYRKEYDKTKDTLIILGKKYYIQILTEDEELIYEQVESPVVENIDNYYDWIFDPLSENYEDIRLLFWVCIKPGNIIIKEDIGIDDLDPIISSDQVGNVVDNLRETAWRVVRIPEDTPAHSVIVDYKAGNSDEFPNSIRSLDHLSVDAFGNLYAFYSNDLQQSYYLTNIGGLDSVSLDDVRGIIFRYTNGSEYSFPLKQILSIDFKEGNPKKDNNGSWIRNETNDLIFYDNEGQEITSLNSILKIRYKDSNLSTVTFPVKRIERIIYNNRDLNSSQYIKVKYLGELSVNVTDNPMNLAIAINRLGDNIFVLYSDPLVRQKIEELGLEYTDWVKIDWTDPVTNISYTGNNALVWKNYGNLGAQYHIQGEYTLADLKGDDTDPDFTIDLSEGFKGLLVDRMGWLITVTDSNESKHLYAFDYNAWEKQTPIHVLYDDSLSYWYEILLLSAEMIKPERVVMVSSVDENNPSIPASTLANYLMNSGLWFVTFLGHKHNSNG